MDVASQDLGLVQHSGDLSHLDDSLWPAHLSAQLAAPVIAPTLHGLTGPTLVTTRDRVLVSLVEDGRRAYGTVWEYDEYDLPSTKPAWWWNPLDSVKDEESADRLASFFVEGWQHRSTFDGFFDAVAGDVLSALFLAASVQKTDIRQVSSWLQMVPAFQPVQVLEASGFSRAVERLTGTLDAPERQRDAIFKTAQLMTSALESQALAAWVSPTWPDLDRPKLDADEFVRVGGTVFLVSSGKEAPSWPFVAALTGILRDAGLRSAHTSKEAVS